MSQNVPAMFIESRDSVSLKPVELDFLGQLLTGLGRPQDDACLERQVEDYSLVSLALIEEEVHGFLFGSLERIGGTPCIVWGLGAAGRGKLAGAILRGLTGELFRRAAISFPDEDVLIAGRIAHPAAYALFLDLDGVVPRPKYAVTGEDRAWGRRLAKRFGCDGRFDDREFRVAANGSPEPILEASAVKGPVKKVAIETVAPINAEKGDAMITFGWAMAESLAASLAQVG